MLNRRKFLWYSFLGMGAATMVNTGYLLTGKVFTTAIGEILLADLKGMRVNPVHIASYAKDVSEKNALGLSFSSITLIKLNHAGSTKFIPLPMNRKYQQLRADIVGNFLLSTNFFYNKMDESKPIDYTGLVHNPYHGACQNPFSGLYYAA